MDGSAEGGFWWVSLWVPIDGWKLHGRKLQGLHHHWGSPSLCFYILFPPFFFLFLTHGHGRKLYFVEVCGWGGGGGGASNLVLVGYGFVLNCVLGCRGCGGGCWLSAAIDYVWYSGCWLCLMSCKYYFNVLYILF